MKILDSFSIVVTKPFDSSPMTKSLWITLFVCLFGAFQTTVFGQYDYDNTCNVNGGVISTTDPTTFCVNDANPTAKVSFSVTGSTGPQRAWFAAGADDIIRIVQDNGNFDFSGLPAGVYRVWYIRWQTGDFAGLEVGKNFKQLTGCFDLSNAIAVTTLTGRDCVENEIKPSILGFVLINALNNAEIRTINNGDKISINDLPTSFLSIRAIVNPDPTGSVLMKIRGRINSNKTENISPYTLFGESSDGNIAGRIFRLGNYTIEAIPYTEANLRGEKGESLKISFSLVANTANLDVPTVENGEVEIFSTEIAEVSSIALSSETSTEAFKVFPNPFTTGLLNVQFAETSEQPINVRVIDLTGKILFQQDFDRVNKGEIVPIELNANDLPNGIYFVQFQGAQGLLLNQKVVKLSNN